MGACNPLGCTRGFIVICATYKPLVYLAEEGGFEPPVECYPYDGLANRCFRPLSHPSVSLSQIRLWSIEV